MTRIFESFFCVAIFLIVSDACNCIQLLNHPLFLKFLIYLSLLQKMHSFGKTVRVVDSLEPVHESVVAFEDEGNRGSSVDSTNASSNASLKA